MPLSDGVVSKVLGNVGDFEKKVKGFDRLLLTSEERSNPHLVKRTETGRVIRISLKRGSGLVDGDVVAVDGDVAIVVAEAPEDLFVVSPRDVVEWGVAGYQLGNLHKQVRFTHDTMLTPDDTAVAGMLDRLEIPYTRAMTPFVGKRYGSHHHHNHDVVAETPENLFVVSPRDAIEWGVAGYQLGNLHKQIQFTHDTMLTPADTTVAGVLDRLEIPYARGVTPFVGKRYGIHHHHNHND